MPKPVKEQLQSSDSMISMGLGLAVVLVVGLLIYNYFTGNKKQDAQKSQTAQEETATVSLPSTHKVQSGETLWKIAETYYKSGYNWVDIAKANNIGNPNLIEKDQQLTIPDVAPRLPEGQTLSATTNLGNKQYTVVKGDSLWKIAESQYGTGYQWEVIAKANNLENPGVIHAGNVLILP